MQDRRETDDDLAFDIGFALKKAKIKLPIEVCRIIATRVVEHLKLAGWHFRRPPPKPPHSAG